jgi:hypothetical protein
VLVLGASKIGVERGLKDDDCALMHEHIYETRGEGVPWLKGVAMAVSFLAAMVGAIHQKRLPNHLPLPGIEQTPLPEPVKCEKFARYSTAVALILGVLMVFLPWLAPRGALPFSLTVCLASALLLRDPRVMVYFRTRLAVVVSHPQM